MFNDIEWQGLVNIENKKKQRGIAVSNMESSVDKICTKTHIYHIHQTRTVDMIRIDDDRGSDERERGAPAVSNMKVGYDHRM